MKFQLVDQETSTEIGLPQSRTAAVEDAQRLIHKLPGHSIIVYPMDWKERADEVYVGTRISEDFPGETDSYRFVIRPV
jgi:hypothetical protein